MWVVEFNSKIIGMVVFVFGSEYEVCFGKFWNIVGWFWRMVVLFEFCWFGVVKKLLYVLLIFVKEIGYK